MVTVWWPAADLIHYSFLNPSETITFEKYAQQMDEMHQELKCLQLTLVRKDSILLSDNTWLYIAQATFQKLNKLGHKVLPHPPYSPDLSPTDYHVFKYPDRFLQGKWLHNQHNAENAFQELVQSQNMDL